MRIKHIHSLPFGIRHVFQFFALFVEFVRFFYGYVQKKVVTASHNFEDQKNHLVKLFMMKRGRYNRPFLHMIAISVLGVIIILSPIIADTYPIFTKTQGTVTLGQSDTQQSITMDSDVFQTQISQKPRPVITMYTVESGDTVSSIAKKFGVSVDTVRWANDLSNDTVTTGDELKIPSVTGIVHKVGSGDTVYTIAKKYDANPQAIVDFPFNEFANPQTFSLVAGQLVMVPEGVKPSEQPTYVRPQRYLASTAPHTVGGGGYAWPVNGTLNQGYAWYHPGIDIGGPVGTPIVATENGTVSAVYTSGYNGGYGIHAIITGADGNQSLYAHMSGANVSTGQAVTAGSTVVGWIGMTGRTTGPHLHFEIHSGGAQVNPLAFLPQ